MFRFSDMEPRLATMHVDKLFHGVLAQPSRRSKLPVVTIVKNQNDRESPKNTFHITEHSDGKNPPV